MLCHLLAPLRLFISVLRAEGNRRGIKHSFKVGETKIEPFLSFLFTLRNPALFERSDKSMSALFPASAAGETESVECHLLVFHSTSNVFSVVNGHHLLHMTFAHYLCSLLEVGCGCLHISLCVAVPRPFCSRTEWGMLGFWGFL